MLDFFVENFSVHWVVVLVAMIPMFESKIALPLGISTQVWGQDALKPPISFILALIGSMIPCFIVILVARYIKNKTGGFIYDNFTIKIEQRYKASFEKLSQKNTTLKKCVMLATFVAIPLPLTGVYTGSLIAGFTNLKIWQAFLSIFIGAVISCTIIFLLSTIFDNSAFYVMIFSLVIIIIFALINVSIYLLSKIKKEKR